MAPSAGECLREIDYWRQLSAKHKVQYVEVTQQLPLDPAGGFPDIYDTLWTTVKVKKVFLYLVLMAKIGLNVWTTFLEMDAFWQNPPWREGREMIRTSIAGIANATFHDNHLLRVCWSANATSMDVEVDGVSQGEPEWICCSHKNFILSWMAFVVGTVEQLAIGSMSIYVVVGWLVFVIGKQNWLLFRYPSVFLTYPRTLATFSMIKLIRYGNPSLFKRLPDLARWKAVDVLGSGFFRCFAPRVLDCAAVSLAFLGGISCTLLGVGTVLLNILDIFWVALHTPETWDLHQWTKLLAFLNRLSAIVDVDELELKCLYLLRYGGYDAKWQSEEFYRVRSYQHLMILSMQQTKFVASLWDRMSLWIVLATFRAQDLQRLWLSKEAEQRCFDPQRLMKRVLELNSLNDPAHWPPVGSDPYYRLENSAKDPLLDPDYEPESRTVSQTSLMRFLDNLQSYRLWNLAGGRGPLQLYDEEGRLRHGGITDVWRPRLRQLSETIASALSRPATADNLEAALLCQLRLEELKCGQREARPRRMSADSANPYGAAGDRAGDADGTIASTIKRTASSSGRRGSVHLEGYLRSLGAKAPRSSANDPAAVRAEALETFMLLQSIGIRDVSQLDAALARQSMPASLDAARDLARQHVDFAEKVDRTRSEAEARLAIYEDNEEEVARVQRHLAAVVDEAHMMSFNSTTSGVFKDKIKPLESLERRLVNRLKGAKHRLCRGSAPARTHGSEDQGISMAVRATSSSSGAARAGSPGLMNPRCTGPSATNMPSWTSSLTTSSGQWVEARVSLHSLRRITASTDDVNSNPSDPVELPAVPGSGAAVGRDSLTAWERE
eukprot:TRINITY_DN122135_c0_g1_i1.p1 TRINITY_DN122135_c0_g1~~TRINITY_DN122135_c0_g1_i1.p1  ORF type:complete len:837 (-),score=159.41 TRINITY_DN122135_c0_g1_i1:3-2513(-)